MYDPTLREALPISAGTIAGEFGTCAPDFT